MNKKGKLVGYTALVTGLSNPLGFEMAKFFATEGCRLHMADYYEQPLKDCLRKFTELYKVDAEIHQIDLSEAINISVLALECQEANIIINTFKDPKQGDISQLELDDWKSSFNLTLFPAINLTRELLDNLYEQERGIIINLGGTISGVANENLCTISVNAALQAFSNSLDSRTRAVGIRVLSFLPEANTCIEENASSLKRLILEKLSSSS